MTQEFKVGDKVQRKESMWTWQKAGSYPQFPKGSVFKVSEYLEDEFYPSVKFEHTGYYQYDAGFFELVLERSSPPKYYVGTHLIRNLDSAKVKADLKDNGWSEGYWRFLNGNVATVVEVLNTEEGFTYKVSVEGTHDTFGISHDEDVAFEYDCTTYTTYTLGQGIKAVDSTIEVEQGANGIGSKPDLVNSPKHYSVFEDVEAIQVIASAMTQDQFFGYCLGNILKYRLRAGSKDDVMQELSKADKYQELFTQYKYLCKEE